MNNKLNGILLVSAITLSGTANSAIIYTADNRFIYTFPYSTYFPTSPYTYIGFQTETEFTSIYQYSTLGSTSMSGEGGSSVYYDGPGPFGVEAASSFNVSFIVDESTNFSLTGILSTSDLENSNVYATLFEDGESIFQFDSSSLLGTSTPFSFNGQFTEGHAYGLRLWAQSYANFNNTDSWEFDLVTNVPLPATAWLFGSGLLGLAYTATRRPIKGAEHLKKLNR